FPARLPSRPRDIEVGPVVLAGELGQKAGRRNAPRRPSADVRKIGEVALELLLVVVPQRKLPDAIPRFGSGLLQFLSEAVLVREQARADVTQGDDDGARERGDVDHRLRLESLGI